MRGLLLPQQVSDPDVFCFDTFDTPSVIHCRCVLDALLSIPFYRCYYQLNQIENSIDDCKYAVHNNKSYSYPLSFMYGLLISQNRIDEAEKELTTLMDECVVEIKRAEEIKIVKKAMEQHEKDALSGHATLGVEETGPSLRSSGDISAALSETIDDFPKMVTEKDYKAYSELRISVQGVDKKLQRCKEFLQILYSLHAELSFMTGSLDAFTSDVVKLNKLKMTHPFVRALNGLLGTSLLIHLYAPY